ncbi:killer cell lectin-like receptor subfamily F member 1 isoform X2 [Trematomus bernacchii]|uniref:killer cell lectin-like receptor subfamily F member 1 isoform X2 n=1 Tax=Trematomus bernacchii TaxID=40690 RepID=UPI00146BD800|nr:killer cell lectin-like receptor subfamily F member 1 isoform X2 [Trematomus bernacchii]
MNRRTQQEMEEIEEQEDDYVNASRGAVDKKRTRPGQRFFLLIAVCWLILLAIMGLRIYLTSELSGNNAELYSRIQELETNWKEHNASRAQWSIDSYCLGNTDKKCLPCQKGWWLSQPSCYAFNNPKQKTGKTWEEAREDCKGKISDLAVVHDPAEKEAINANSFGTNVYWIGLRVEDGKWKWVDGSDLTDSSWIDPPVDGRCAVFYKGINTDK